MDVKFLECQLWFTQQNCLLNLCPNEIIFNDYDWIILRLDNFIIELQRYWSWIENNSGLFSFYLIFFSTEIAFAFLHTCVNVCGCATHIYYELHFPDYVWRHLLHWSMSIMLSSIFFRPFSFKAQAIILILALALIVASIFVEVASQSAFRNMLSVFSYCCRWFFLPFCNNELMLLYFRLFRLLVRFLEMLHIAIKYSRENWVSAIFSYCSIHCSISASCTCSLSRPV